MNSILLFQMEQKYNSVVCPKTTDKELSDAHNNKLRQDHSDSITKGILLWQYQNVTA